MPPWKPKTAAILPVDDSKQNGREPVRFGVRREGPLRPLPSRALSTVEPSSNGGTDPSKIAEREK
jgi:hypothetical protein